MNLVTSSQSGLFAEPPLSPTPLASAVEPPAMPAPVVAPPVAPPVAPAPVVHAPAPEAAPIEEPPAAPSDRRADLPLEAQLVRMGLLTLEQLAEANRTRLESGGTVAEIVVANGWVTPEQLAVLTGDAAVAAPAPAPAPAPAVEPEPEPVVELSVPVPPPAAPAPEIAPPLRMAEVEQPAPLAPVEPIAAAPAAPAPAPVAGMFCVAVRLQGGERVDVLAGVDEQTAQHRAREIVSELARARPDEWPHYAGRFLRPDAILSVDVLQDE